MNPQQRIAMAYPARFAFETAHPRFCHRLKYGASLVLTINHGHE